MDGTRSIGQWLSLFAAPGDPVRPRLQQIYGPDPDELAKRTPLWVDALGRAQELWGAHAEVLLIRAAGRINIMGMHIDHRGGSINTVALGDVIFVVQPRNDDRVVLRNIDEDRFPPEEFAISEELPRHKIDDWDHWTQQEFQKRQLLGTAGDWSNYVKAAVLYLQHMHTSANGTFSPFLQGMSMLVCGSVPVASGLSSSSSIVVGTAAACMRINGLEMSDADLIDACGQGEWYVGTRGGSGDHAGILLSRRGQIAHLGSFPPTVEMVPFPEGCVLVLCSSLKEAKKTAGARNVFNERVACYEFGLLLLRRCAPDLADKMERLRDVSPEHLGVDDGRIYEMLKFLPERTTRDELLDALPDQHATLQRIFASHEPTPEGYRVRQAVLFGAAECLRSEMAAQFLKAGDARQFGELMVISHNGDRVSRLVDGQRVAVDNAVSDERLDQLIADVRSTDPERAERARLWRQPGGYDVSCVELDELVDLSLTQPGVLGAGRVGAGLGGVVVVLVEKVHAQGVVDAVAQQYYGPRGLPVAAEVCVPVDGAGVFDVDDTT